MKLLSLDFIYNELNYRNRFLLSLITSQLILIAIFAFWPNQVKDEKAKEMIFASEFFIEETIITQQPKRAVAPPKPRTPIPVPNDEIIEIEIELPEFDDIIAPDLIANDALGQQGDSDEIVGKPQRLPSILRIVEAIVPEKLQNENLKAEIYVTMVVGKDGSVEEAFITKMMVFKNKDTSEIVENIDPALVQATLEAAFQWKFRPALNEGETVKAYSRQVFSFGF